MPKIADGDSGLKTDELAWNMKKQSVEICGIQEHRQVHKTDRIDDINCYKVGLGYELYTPSAWRNTMQAVTGGVGIVIGKIAQRALIGVDRISDRLIKATFQGNPALTVIVAYAPCEYAASTDKTDFNDNLRQAIEAVSCERESNTKVV
ncbi:craniofacial development protein 2-like [Diadema antillarum]|uniref:craniofacial development protein 2-like n=1 Tax=Diadema antillarum TaxID=105358 RepID=UPI003A842FE9